jgi:alkyl sulfatase BDS1-like metallo-beta-lactamase superfamily hydrolase
MNRVLPLVQKAGVVYNNTLRSLSMGGSFYEMIRSGRIFAVMLSLCALMACQKSDSNSSPSQMPAQSGRADWLDKNDARKGFIAAPTGQIKDAQGKVIWDFDAFAFVQGNAPATVNPSLWRQATLNNQIGLFKVTEGIWQLRGFDLANMTLIQGKTGWIVVDALTAQETSAAALAFARQHLGPQKVSGLIFTHSHTDHFGGALGVVSAEEAKARKLPIVAPSGFMEEATSENILMGPAMGRRAMYMYGSNLPKNPTGLVDNGLGKAVAFGKLGILEPNITVESEKKELLIDGVRFIFHNVPGSEAPSEFTFYLPDFKAFCGAEIMGHTLHNLYTLRGAKVRDATKWASYLNDSLRHVENSEVVFNQHHWPVWGAANIQDFIVKQRDTYQFIHDQTVRQMNAGLNAAEIAENLRLPPSLDEHLSVRGYYGTVRHNVKAVYQNYMGWFDAHPSNLDPLPALQASEKYVQLMGGVDKVVAAAQEAMAKADYRWAAELLKHAVYVAPKHAQAKEMLAQSFEKLGYAAESSAWRNFYLTGAMELRQGTPEKGLPREGMIDMLNQTPIERFLEAMAASLNAPKAEGKKMKINLVFSDTKQSFVLCLENSVLHHVQAQADQNANATLTLTKPFFIKMVLGQAGGKDLLLSDQTKIKGSTIDLALFFSMLDKAPGNFSIVTRALQ